MWARHQARDRPRLAQDARVFQWRGRGIDAGSAGPDLRALVADLERCPRVERNMPLDSASRKTTRFLMRPYAPQQLLDAVLRLGAAAALFRGQANI